MCNVLPHTPTEALTCRGLHVAGPCPSGGPHTLPAVQDAEGRNLWDLTWHKARGISSGLTPQLLASSGVQVTPAMPEPTSPRGDIGGAKHLLQQQ